MKNTNKKSSAIRNFLRATRGANMVEYILLVGVVALLCIGGFSFFGEKVKGTIGAQAKTVSTVNSAPGAPPL